MLRAMDSAVSGLPVHIYFHFDLTIWLTDSHCIIIFIFHHHAFQNSLSADPGIVRCFFLFNVQVFLHHGQACVAQNFPQAVYITAVFQVACSKRMSQQVRV